VTTQSLSYLLMLAAVWLLYRLLPQGSSARRLALLGASLLFYLTWGVGFLIALTASAAVNYVVGRRIRATVSVNWLYAGLAFNIAYLSVFKYLPVGRAVLPMPVGVSFWTFQAISYLVDLYREEELDPAPAEFLLYMSFWPTVLSGPVSRLGEMLGQFRAAATPVWDDIAAGCGRIVTGLLMKTVLAQVLQDGIDPGTGVDYGFDQLSRGWGALDVWLLAFGYGLQLFFDFAGYSHIVIGSARLFGIRLPENFHSPYLSPTPSVFWTRWHMSLSSWIRDYVFLPLATARREAWWKHFALAASMVLFGLWHGARWTYIAWGLAHGLILVGHRLVQSWKRRSGARIPLEGLLSWGTTVVLVMLVWVLFRSNSVGQAMAMYGAILSPANYGKIALKGNFYFTVPLVVVGYFAVAWAARLSERLGPARLALRIASPAYYAAALLLIVVWSGQNPPFLYLQF
jgi:alginate O-acetyltransferase complex protein AlgI